MAKKKQRLDDRLSGGVPSWEDQADQTAGPQEPVPETDEDLDKTVRKTLILTPRLVQRIKATAQAEKVGQNDLVRHLLTRALDQVDSGEYKLPKQERYTLG